MRRLKKGIFPPLENTLIQAGTPVEGGCAASTFCFSGLFQPLKQSGRHDSNMRPLGPKPVAIPDCELQKPLLSGSNANLPKHYSGVNVSFVAINGNRNGNKKWEQKVTCPVSIWDLCIFVKSMGGNNRFLSHVGARPFVPAFRGPL